MVVFCTSCNDRHPLGLCMRSLLYYLYNSSIPPIILNISSRTYCAFKNAYSQTRLKSSVFPRNHILARSLFDRLSRDLLVDIKSDIAWSITDLHNRTSLSIVTKSFGMCNSAKYGARFAICYIYSSLLVLFENLAIVFQAPSFVYIEPKKPKPFCCSG